MVKKDPFEAFLTRNIFSYALSILECYSNSEPRHKCIWYSGRSFIELAMTLNILFWVSCSLLNPLQQRSYHQKLQSFNPRYLCQIPTSLFVKLRYKRVLQVSCNLRNWVFIMHLLCYWPLPSLVLSCFVSFYSFFNFPLFLFLSYLSHSQCACRRRWGCLLSNARERVGSGLQGPGEIPVCSLII